MLSAIILTASEIFSGNSSTLITDMFLKFLRMISCDLLLAYSNKKYYFSTLVTTSVIESISFLTSMKFVSEYKSDFDFSVDIESRVGIEPSRLAEPSEPAELTRAEPKISESRAERA